MEAGRNTLIASNGWNLKFLLQIGNQLEHIIGKVLVPLMRFAKSLHEIDGLLGLLIQNRLVSSKRSGPGRVGD